MSARVIPLLHNRILLAQALASGFPLLLAAKASHPRSAPVGNLDGDVQNRVSIIIA